MTTDSILGGRVLLLAVASLAAASASSGQDVGYRGPSLAGAGPNVGWPTVTESKPQSKVWLNDGFWWASIWSPAAQTFRIHKLNQTTHVWTDTGVLVDPRPDSHSDALWDGTKLYIGTHEYSTSEGTPGDPLVVLRYSYAPASDTYSMDTGFPVTIGDCKTEALVIEKDSTGMLWAVWKQQNRVFFTHTLGSDTAWRAPAILPPCTSNFDNDDICSVIRFGNRIGVMWSDQVLDTWFFTTHLDGAPDTNWTAVEMPLPGEVDDHLHLEADASGRVYAVVKNQFNQTKLLRRTAGTWQQFLVADSGLQVTRARMLLDEPGNKVHVFYTVGSTAQGGTIHQKTSALGTISFAPGTGTLILQDSSGLLLNNATSTKQNVTAATGLVVLAANTSEDGHTWHHEVPGGLVISLAPGTAGVQNTLTITGATPNVLISFFTSQAQGTSVINRPNCPGGITTGLGSPYYHLGTVRASGAGVATLTMQYPANLAGSTWHFQAIESATCRASNRITDQL